MCIRWWSLCRDRPKFIESKVTEEVAYNVKDASLDLARFDPFRDFPSIWRKKTRPTGVCLEESGDQIWPIFERPYQQIVLQKLSKYLSTFRAISKKINYKLLWLLFCRSFWKVGQLFTPTSGRTGPLILLLLVDVSWSIDVGPITFERSSSFSTQAPAVDVRFTRDH